MAIFAAHAGLAQDFAQEADANLGAVRNSRRYDKHVRPEEPFLISDVVERL